jgi:orotidine-5'-phosphate decarboxylase
MAELDPGNRLIAAIDVPNRAEAEAFLARLGGVPSWVKLGLELFVAEGPGLVRDVAARARVMLDLKLHDIPETVGRATRQAAALGAGLLTVHAAGGRAMLEAAVRAAREAARAASSSGGSGSAGAGAAPTRILAITVLTSLDEADLAAIGATGPVADLVIRRARLAADAGCDGVVASPHEVAAIRAACGPRFLIVTPGVRPAGAGAGDQKRVMTPAAARAAGADLVVVGRPLRDAPDPAAAARAIVAELSSS